jgi:hypothetical protein
LCVTQDLLGLDLHLHVEGVNELVQVASEELKVETRLKVMDDPRAAINKLLLHYGYNQSVEAILPRAVIGADCPPLAATEALGPRS